MELYDSFLRGITIPRTDSDASIFLGRLPKTITLTYRVIKTWSSLNGYVVDENFRDTISIPATLLTRLTGLQNVLNPRTFNALLPHMLDELVHCLDRCQENLERMHHFLFDRLDRAVSRERNWFGDSSKVVLKDYGLELDTNSQQLFDILNEILMYSIFEDSDNLDLVKYRLALLRKRLKRCFGQVTRRRLRK
jgi:hypothetical protein